MEKKRSFRPAVHGALSLVAASISVALSHNAYTTASTSGAKKLGSIDMSDGGAAGGGSSAPSSSTGQQQQQQGISGEGGQQVQQAQGGDPDVQVARGQVIGDSADSTLKPGGTGAAVADPQQA